MTTANNSNPQKKHWFKRMFIAIGRGIRAMFKGTAQVVQGVNQQSIRLGEEYIDTITGFHGVASSYQVSIDGNEQVFLEPMVKASGKLNKGEWFPVGRVEQ